VSQPPLGSATWEVADAFEANERFQREGLTDGLPIVPPTEALVRRALDAAELPPDAVIAVEPVRRRRITAEKVAIATVMAGGRPEYLPVVTALVRAVAAPEFGLHGCTASTGGSAPFVVDRSTFGHPGKFTFCVAEDEEGSPWPPLAADRGIPAGASAVTVLAAESPHQVMNEWTTDPREILETYAAAIRANMLTYSIWPGNYAILVAPQQREHLAAAGWSKADVRECVFERARVRRGDWRAVGKAAVAARKDEERVHTALRAPDDLLVVAAGGPAGGFGVIVPPWYGAKSLAVTARVGGPGEGRPA
jgi:hypothetical protein